METMRSTHKLSLGDEVLDAQLRAIRTKTRWYFLLVGSIALATFWIAKSAGDSRTYELQVAALQRERMEHSLVRDRMLDSIGRLRQLREVNEARITEQLKTIEVLVRAGDSSNTDIAQLRQDLRLTVLRNQTLTDSLDYSTSRINALSDSASMVARQLASAEDSARISGNAASRWRDSSIALTGLLSQQERVNQDLTGTNATLVSALRATADTLTEARDNLKACRNLRDSTVVLRDSLAVLSTRACQSALPPDSSTPRR
jgi:hypothetical protein